MLALGLSACDMLTSQHFREPKLLDSQIVTKFLPALLSLMVDDQVRNLNAKLPPDERESAIAIIEHSGTNPIFNFLMLIYDEISEFPAV
jgi:negative elongation factor B